MKKQKFMQFDRKLSLKEEEVDTRVLGAIIQKDMGMTAKILKLVNSSFFGLVNIKNFSHALENLLQDLPAEEF